MNAVVDSHRLHTGGTLASNAVLASHNISAPTGLKYPPANTVLAANGTGNIPNIGHWVALENRAAIIHTVTDMQTAFGFSNYITGAVLRKFWRDLEGSEGDYSAGFATIDTWLAACEAEAVPRKMILVIVDKTYRNDHRDPLPTYMAAYKVENTEELHTPDGWGITGQRWHSTYVAKLAAMINAYQARYDGRPGWEGVRYSDESALGLTNLSTNDLWSTLDLGASPPPAVPGSNPQAGAPWYNKPGDTPAGYNAGGYPTPTTDGSPCGASDTDGTRKTINGIQYTSTLYRDALIALIDATEATRPNSWFYLSGNYMTGSSNSDKFKDIVDHIYNSGSPMRVICGNNNATYTTAGQISNSFNNYYTRAGITYGMPLWVSVEQMDYSLAVTLTQIFDYFTKSAAAGGNAYNWGNRLHCIQWFYFSGTYNFATDAVAIIDAVATRTFNTTFP